MTSSLETVVFGTLNWPEEAQLAPFASVHRELKQRKPSGSIPGERDKVVLIPRKRRRAQSKEPVQRAL